MFEEEEEKKIPISVWLLSDILLFENCLKRFQKKQILNIKKKIENKHKETEKTTRENSRKRIEKLRLHKKISRSSSLYHVEENKKQKNRKQKTEKTKKQKNKKTKTKKQKQKNKKKQKKKTKNLTKQQNKLFCFFSFFRIFVTVCECAFCLVVSFAFCFFKINNYYFWGCDTLS